MYMWIPFVLSKTLMMKRSALHKRVVGHNVLCALCTAPLRLKRSRPDSAAAERSSCAGAGTRGFKNLNPLN